MPVRDQSLHPDRVQRNRSQNPDRPAPAGRYQHINALSRRTTSPEGTRGIRTETPRGCLGLHMEMVGCSVGLRMGMEGILGLLMETADDIRGTMRLALHRAEYQPPLMAGQVGFH